ncbi:MAG: ATP-binding protein [Planctomycetota bacterium]
MGEIWKWISQLWDESGFTPRWYCGQWSEALGYTHIVADLMVFLAYVSIPVALTYFMLKRRRDLPFGNLFWLFSLFIFSCGTVHLVEAIIFWHPVYRLSAFTKVVTALASWGTVLFMIPIIPKALALPGVKKLNEHLQDMTHRLKRSNEDLEAFTYIASHDLKAPLRAIGNLLSWSKEEVGTSLDPKVADAIDKSVDQVKRMNLLIDNLLIYARGEKSHEPVSDVDMAHAARSALSMLAIPDHFHISIQESMPKARISPTQVQQIFLNFFTNAFKYNNKEAGSLVVGWSEKDRAYFVEDNGQGVPEHDRQRIFNLFERGATHVDGSGLGLAIIRKIVLSVGGAVWVTMTPEGRTRFLFRLSRG